MILKKIKRNIFEIQEGGVSVLANKILIKLTPAFNFIIAPFIILLVFIFKLISTIRPIRIQRLDIGRIGHNYPAFSYLARKKMKMDIGQSIDLFYFESSTGVISNQQLKKMLKRNLNIIPAGLILSHVKKWGQRMFGEQTFSLGLPAYKIGKKNWLEYKYHNNFAIMSFSQEEIANAEMQLQDMGIPPGAKFICFHVRDSAYLDKIAPERNWQYHDYRDATLSSYLPAIKKFSDETGYYFVRMGAIAKEKITEKNNKIIDYANSIFRSDLLDIYLSHRCEFFIASDSGMSIFPEMMGKSIVFLNMVCLAHFDPWGHDVLYIPKKFYLRNEKRYLSFNEILTTEIGMHPSTELMREHGIELEENTADEIYDILIEMKQSLGKTLKLSDEDFERQKKYWLIRGRRHSGTNIRIGSDFLKKYKSLLERIN